MSETCEIAKQVIPLSSELITFDDDEHYGPKSPDIAFGCRAGQYLGVILEVSYSQRRRDLAGLAQAYILGSYAKIKVVVGIDMDYNTKVGTIQVWRPATVVNMEKQKILIVKEEVLAHVSYIKYIFVMNNMLTFK